MVTCFTMTLKFNVRKVSFLAKIYFNYALLLLSLIMLYFSSGSQKHKEYLDVYIAVPEYIF